MSLCYVYNVNVIPHPRENYIVPLPKIHVCLGPLWQTEIFLPLEKIMDPRMMLVGIYRRYEYIGDYRCTHRCTRVTCSCYLHVFSMKSFISCQSSKNCPRPTLLAEKNCHVFEAQVWYAWTIYLARIQAFFSVKRRSWWKRDIRVCRGEGGPRYISQIKLRNLHFQGSSIS